MLRLIVLANRPIYLSPQTHKLLDAGLVASPIRIVVGAQEAFSLQCRSIRPGQMPYARLVSTLINMENDPRYQISRPSQELLVIKSPRGLALTANNTLIE